MSGRRDRDHGHGATPRELEIIDLVDAGVPHPEIARRMGVGIDYVRNTIRLLSMEETPNDRAFFAMIRQGSEALARRLAEVRGSFA